MFRPVQSPVFSRVPSASGTRGLAYQASCDIRLCPRPRRRTRRIRRPHASTHAINRNPTTTITSNATNKRVHCLGSTVVCWAIIPQSLLTCSSARWDVARMSCMATIASFDAGCGDTAWQTVLGLRGFHRPVARAGRFGFRRSGHLVRFPSPPHHAL